MSNEFFIIAGPCSVESDEQINTITNHLVQYPEVKLIRGGAFKPRTSPHSFQGLGKEGLVLLKMVKDTYHCPVVSEIMDKNDLLLFDDIDVLQIGARNMQNYPLLRAVGETNKPVILKRGFGNTIEELLASAQYISDAGNDNIILCERGIRSFSNENRFVLDLGAIPVLKQRCEYPIIVDPSHAAGDHHYVIDLAKAAKAVGANGIMVEVHNHPEVALSDSQQQLDLAEFDQLIAQLKTIK